MTSSVLIAASISEADAPLTTFEVTFPGAYLAEVVSNREISVTVAGGLLAAQRHLGPVRAVMTATNWDLFFTKYRSLKKPFPLQELVQDMAAQRARTTPTLRALDTWHLPYIDQDTIEDACLLALQHQEEMSLSELDAFATRVCRQVSVYRCHVVSTPPSIAMTIADQVAGYEDLLNRSDGVLPSAFDHQARPDIRTSGGDWRAARLHGNLRGWMQNSQSFVFALPSTHKQESAVNG